MKMLFLSFSHTVLKWGAYFPPGTMVRNSPLLGDSSRWELLMARGRRSIVSGWCVGSYPCEDGICAATRDFKRLIAPLTPQFKVRLLRGEGRSRLLPVPRD